jgi:L-lactate dehydrogenase complex protein LldG
MATARESFLQRVRAAVHAGNRPGAGAAIEPRGTVGYQGAGPDLAARFGAELAAAGGQLHVVPSDAEAAAKVAELVQSHSSRRVLLGQGPVLDRLCLADTLRSGDVEVYPATALAPEAARDKLFEVDIGITGVDYLIAETGTVAVMARPGDPRSVSLLPPVHIAVAARSQLIPDLFDLFTELERRQAQEGLPSSVVLITGPSKTGDIELRLVTGVHGPGQIHVVLIAG